MKCVSLVTCFPSFVLETSLSIYIDYLPGEDGTHLIYELYKYGIRTLKSP